MLPVGSRTWIGERSSTKPIGPVYLKAEVFESTVGLAIQQQVSTFVPTTTGVNASPTLLKRELNTAINLKSGEVLVLGGLQEERDGEARSGPGFFSFLGSKSRDESRTELILLLPATVSRKTVRPRQRTRRESPVNKRARPTPRLACCGG